jgi:hypothetical protein
MEMERPIPDFAGAYRNEGNPDPKRYTAEHDNPSVDVPALKASSGRVPTAHEVEAAWAAAERAAKQGSGEEFVAALMAALDAAFAHEGLDQLPDQPQGRVTPS